MNEEDVDAFLAHYGVKGMRWGRRKAQDSSGPRTPTRKELKKMDRTNRDADIDAARERVAKAEAAGDKNIEKYDRDKKLIGKYAAEQALKKAESKLYDDAYKKDVEIAIQAKSGRESITNVLITGGAVLATVLFSESAKRTF